MRVSLRFKAKIVFEVKAKGKPTYEEQKLYQIRETRLLTSCGR